MQVECEELREGLARLKSEINECNILRVNMLVSIETLTEENHVCMSELKKLRYKNSGLKSSINAHEQLSLSPVVAQECAGFDIQSLCKLYLGSPSRFWNLRPRMRGGW